MPPRGLFGAPPDSVANAIHIESYFNFSEREENKRPHTARPEGKNARPRPLEDATAFGHAFSSVPPRRRAPVCTEPRNLIDSLPDAVGDPLQSPMPRVLSMGSEAAGVSWLKPNADTVEALSTQQRKLRLEVEEKTATVERLVSHISVLRTKLSRAESTNQTLIKEILTSKGSQSDGKVESTPQMMEAVAAAELRALKAELNAAESEAQAFSKTEAKAANLAKLEKEYESLRRQRDDLTHQSKVDQQRLQIADLRCSALEEKLRDTEAHTKKTTEEALKPYEAVLSQNLQLQEQIAILQGSLSAQKTAVKDAEIRKGNADRSAEAAKVKLQEEVEHFNSMIEKTKSQYETEISRLKIELEESNRKAASIREANIKLEENTRALESIHTQLADKSRQLSLAQSDEKAAQQEKRSERTKRLEAESALELAQREIEMNRTTAREAQKNAEDLRRLAEKSRELELKMSESEKAKSSEVWTLQNTIEILQKERDSAKSRLAETDQNLNLVNARVKELQSVCDGLQQSNARLEANISSAQNDANLAIARGENEQRALQGEVEAGRARFAALKEQFDELQEQMKIKAEDNVQLQRQKSRLQREKELEVARLEGDLQSIAANKNQVEENAVKQQGAVTKLTTELANLKAKFDSMLRDKDQEIQANTRKKEKELTVLKAEMERLKAQSVSEPIEDNELKKEVETLRSQLKEYEEAVLETGERSWLAKLGETMLLNPASRPPEDIKGAYDEVQIKCRKAAAIIASQKKKISSLTDELAAMREDNGGWFDKINPMRMVKGDVSSKQELELQAKLDQLTADLKHARKLQEVWEAPVSEALREEGGAIDDQSGFSEETPIVERYETTKRRFETLKVLYSKMHQRLTVDNTPQERATDEVQLSNFRSRLEEANRQLEQVAEQRDALRVELDNTLHEKERLKNDTKEKDGAVEAKYREAEERWKKKLAEAEAREQQKDAESQAEALALKTNYDELQRRVEALAQAGDDPRLLILESSNAELQQTVEQLLTRNAELERSEKSQAFSSDQAQELEKLLEGTKSLEEENRLLRDSLEAVQKQVAEAGVAQKDTITEERDQLEQEVKKVGEKVLRANEKVRAAEEKAEKAKQKAQELEKLLEGTKSLEEENRLLRDSLEAVQKQVAEAGVAQKDTITEERDKLEQEVKEVGEKVVRANEKVRAAEEKAEKAKQKEKELHERVVMLEHELEDTKKLAGGLEAQGQAIRKLEDERRAIEEQLNGAKKNLQHVEQQKIELNSKLQETEKKVGSLSEMSTATLKEIEQLKSEKSTREEEVAALLKENEKMKAKLDSIAEKVKQKRDKAKKEEKAGSQDEKSLQKKEKKKEKEQGSGASAAASPGAQATSKDPVDTMSATTGLLSAFGLGEARQTTPGEPVGLLSAFGLGGGADTTPATDSSLMTEKTLQKKEKKTKKAGGAAASPGDMSQATSIDLTTADTISTTTGLLSAFGLGEARPTTPGEPAGLLSAFGLGGGADTTAAKDSSLMTAFGFPATNVPAEEESKEADTTKSADWLGGWGWGAT